MATVAMTVNGKPVTADIDPRVLLVQFVRENLRLTGTHVGCDTSQCGACVVHVDGRAVKACTAARPAMRRLGGDDDRGARQRVRAPSHAGRVP
jgi:carbon-monoxide dehydrogenase small subunit